MNKVRSMKRDNTDGRSCPANPPSSSIDVLRGVFTSAAGVLGLYKAE